MEEVQHRTASSWVAAINKEHELLHGDDQKRRLFGFYDHTDEKRHLLTSTRAKATAKDLPRDQRQQIRTPNGRRTLLEG